MRRQSLQTWLLAAAAACLAVFLLRVLNVVPSAAPWLWDKAYNATEIFVIVVCALRARAARGTERAAWAVLTIGLFGYAAGDIYYVVALEGLDAPPYPSWADAGYLSIFPAPTSRSSCSCAPAPVACRRCCGSTGWCAG